METFRTLIVEIEEAKGEEFDSLIRGLATEQGWEEDKESEKNYLSMVGEEASVFVFKTPNSATLEKAKLWARRKNDLFSVINIVPTEKGELSYSEYNAILENFTSNVINKENIEMDISINLSENNFTINDIIEEEAGKALVKFSEHANKATGNSNPYDLEMWCEFVILLHRKNVDLGYETFVRWLTEEKGWPDKIAHKLGSDLEYSIALLEKYDRS